VTRDVYEAVDDSRYELKYAVGKLFRDRYQSGMSGNPERFYNLTTRFHRNHDPRKGPGRWLLRVQVTDTEPGDEQFPFVPLLQFLRRWKYRQATEFHGLSWLDRLLHRGPVPKEDDYRRGHEPVWH
jgi:hypothetical protein